MTKTHICDFPIVAIGASAGGLSAFEMIFSNLPRDSDLDVAFIVVQHLAPDYKSILSDIIQRYTTIPVFEIEDGIEVKRNSIYIAPAGYDVAFVNGTLQLFKPSHDKGPHLPIDFLFKSLADAHKEKTIAVVLSGTGHDGTQGVEAIKAAGGMVIAQDPDSADYDSMPLSVIATGCTDYIVAPFDMPEYFISDTDSVEETINRPLINENSLMKIFVLLRSRTGHDFSQYKPSTMKRRIERRMLINNFQEINDYIRYLQDTQNEAEFLFHELLIGVTNFFRDPETFEAFEQIMPQLFEDKAAGSTIRVWTAGCSTGEEAYSLAILFEECIQKLDNDFHVQIFATDIDPYAIARARTGMYSEAISKDVSSERLKKFFVFEPDSNTYRINKKIRNMLIFSEHNIIKDPPFSKLDLISCRNLLIYMNSELQKKLMPLFHYALNPGGILYLGSSETIGEFGNIFSVIDSKSKLYKRKENVRTLYPLVVDPYLSTGKSMSGPVPSNVFKQNHSSKRLPLRRLTEDAILKEIPELAVLVNAQGDILYTHGRSGKFLELAAGETDRNNILKMARDGLQMGLTMALDKATATKKNVYTTGWHVENNGGTSTVDIRVSTVITDSVELMKSGLYLIIFEESAVQKEQESGNASNEEETITSDAQEQVLVLSKELREKEEFLRITNEKLRISVEDLRSSNEEMQSMNEELQSSNEELETSKEELQSVNEELSTVNIELQAKVEDLSRSNNDMNNLLAGTGIGTIFVDNKLCILRFTPAVEKIINLIPSDLGRPMSHIVSNFVGYEDLNRDVQEVLDTLAQKKKEVQTRDGRWYLMYIQPYRTVDNVIEGAVITFDEVTETIKVREELRKANIELLRFAVVVRDAHDAITVHDTQGRILSWNPGAVKMYGWSEKEALKMNTEDRIPEKNKAEEKVILQKLFEGEVIEPYTTQRLNKKGDIINVRMTYTVLLNSKDEIYAVATTESLLA